MCHIMQAITIRELKHATSSVLARVEGGETIEVRRRNKPVAVLSPVDSAAPIALPDFKARLRSIYGKKLLLATGTDLISESRGDS